MSTRPRSYRTALAALVHVVACAACGTPRTDIDATSTEDVGFYDLQSTERGSTLVGRVCVANPKSSDEIVARIEQQLLSHAYTAITLDVYSHDRAIGRYVWTPGGSRREPLPTHVNPCADMPSR